jgi:hypothetical protein
MGTPDGEPILPIYPMNRRASCHYISPHKGVGDWQVVPLTATATPGTGRACPYSGGKTLGVPNHSQFQRRRAAQESRPWIT